MRVALPHKLGKDEVRRRIKSRSGELDSLIPGGMASIETSWAGEDRMLLGITAMGQSIPASVTIEETQMIVEVSLPPSLGFVSGIIEGTVGEKGTKLLK